MLKNWEELKKQIIIETNDYFSSKNLNIDETIDLLKLLINVRLDDCPYLGGVTTNITNAFFTIFDIESTRKDRLAHVEFLKNVEPFLKKILYFHNKNKLIQFQNDHKGLAPYLRTLGLNPTNIDLSESSLRNFSYNQFEYHLIKTYIIRNTESHNMELWTSRELEANIITLTIFYVETINRCKNYLQGKIITKNLDFNDYIKDEISLFQEQISRFVETKTIEDLALFQGYAVEHKNITDSEETTERSGTVNYIRLNCLPEKRMLLWGEAGLGKSTTFQYLCYIDSKAYLDGISEQIPVYIPLGMLIDKNISIETYIFNKLNIDLSIGRELLKKGKLNLFLDGVNEIPEDSNLELLTIRIREIQNLIDTYKDTQILLSNRPEKNNRFRNVPVFKLQKMDSEKINEFLEKNCSDKNIKNKITSHIQSNPRLLKVIASPLMATRLVILAKNSNDLPESEGLIIREFLNTLYKRESSEKQDPRFDESKIDYLLSDLALYGFNKNNTNSGLTKIEVIKCFVTCLERLHFEYDTSYALDILLKLGVLSCDKSGEIIVFAHQAYQDYYVSRTSLSENIKKKI